jgi:hypothetical protein
MIRRSSCSSVAAILLIAGVLDRVEFLFYLVYLRSSWSAARTS